MSAITEQLQWHDAAAAKPDADITVLLWLQYEDGDAEFARGWWDGEQWRDASSGAPIGSVTGLWWAEPKGPNDAT